jgi:PEP-CTERM/exosortase A-associated glycosyltransferase
MLILHVLDHSIPLQSGYTFRTLAILKEQRAFGWETAHLTSAKQRPEGGDEEHVDGWHFHRTHVPASVLSRIPAVHQLRLMAGTARAIESVIRRRRPDVIHVHSPVLNALPALRAGKRHGIPVVYEVRAFWEDAAVDHGSCRAGGMRYRASRALETVALRRADAVTTICEGLRRDIVARGIAAEKVTVIPNAVDVAAFSSGCVADAALKTRLGLEGAAVLGFIGSFYAYEGLALLIRALPRILRNHADARLLLVGGGPQEAMLRRLVADLALGDRVLFTGRVPHGDVQRYYELIDVLVYPRLPMRLTELVTPLKPLEAMAQGRVVMASNVGGHRELISDGDTGMLFRAGDEASLAETASSLLAHRDRWPGLRARGRRFVENERSWKRCAAGYREIFGRLVGAAA